MTCHDRRVDSRDPIADLRHIAFLLERAHESTYRVRAFRGAIVALARRDPDEVARIAAAGDLKRLKGVGDVTARCVVESLRGEVPAYLQRLEDEAPEPVDPATEELLTALRGDCHSHTDASDGGSPLYEMAATARGLGHEYLVVTDHSPRLTVANGLSPQRLRAQLDQIAELNTAIGSGFRVLTGIEVDINEDGSLDQSPEVLDRLDVVVGSVHSELRMPERPMTRRMVTALADPNLDVLGHCTGRMKAARRNRPPSTFDAEIVFAAAARFDKAVEVNSRPERLDPPKRLLRLAVEAGCRVSIDSDAHTLGQLSWLRNGCERAFLCGVTPEMVVNALPTDDLLAWTASHRS